MNRYLIEGLIRDLHVGKTIVVIAPNMRQSLRVFNEVAGAMCDDHETKKITHAHGRECIEMHNGARLRTIAANCQGGRGFNADVVTILDWNQLSDNQRQDILGYHGATRAEVIRQ